VSRTLFERIIEGELPSEKVFENERILAIKDIHPQAPVHILIMPKKPYKSMQVIPAEEMSIVSEIIEVAQKIAIEMGIEDNYRFLTNNGSKAGQSVFHLHFHLIGGKELGPLA